MANPHTKMITFPEETLGTGDTWQLILTFTVNTNAPNTSVNSFDHGMEITDHGSSSWDFDLEDLTLMPGNTNISIADTEDYIHDLLFGVDTTGLATEKQFKVQILLNGSNEFSGYSVEDDVQYNMADKILTFSACPRIDILKNTALYNKDGDALDPLEYGTLSNAATLLSIIDDIAELVYAGASPEVYHDWVFTDDHSGESGFSDLYALLSTFYDNSSIKYNDLTEVIKAIMNPLFSRIVFYNENTYGIEKIGYYNTGNTQTIDVIKHEKELRWGKLQYSRFDYVTVSGNGTFEYPNANAITNLDSAKIFREFNIYAGPAPLGYASSNIYTSDFYEIQYVRDPVLYPYNADLYACAAFCYIDYRGAIKNVINHKFTVKGVSAVLNKTIIYDGGYYQINKLVKNWEKETSEIEAIYCAAVV